MSKKANPTKPTKGGGKGKAGGAGWLLFLIGILSVGGMWLYGFTGLILGIIGIRYAKKNSKAAGSSVGHAGMVMSWAGTIISIIYLIAWAIKLLA